MNLGNDSFTIDWSSTINILLTSINVIIASYLATEAKKLREAETDPEIAIYLDKNEVIEGVYDIVVRNIGNGPAYNITFIFDQNSELIQQSQFRKLHELGFFQGVEYMAPKQEYRVMFGGAELFKDPPFERLLIKVEYKRKDNKKFTGSFFVDPSDYWGTIYMSKKTITQIHDRLKDIKDEISKISSKMG
jgi:hypothetical protein